MKIKFTGDDSDLIISNVKIVYSVVNHYTVIECMCDKLHTMF